jgi:FMN phosphatase YigB (HAD superfamily)
MRRPSGIIFDLGDTVLHLESLDPLKGNRSVLAFADYNPGVTAEDATALADEMFLWIGNVRDESMLEISARSFNRLIYETLGVTFRVDYDELEKIFWDETLSYKPVDGIYDLLDTLDNHGIKAGVLSNSIYGGAILGRELEKHDLAKRFSFVISSADYGIRKPHGYIFRVAIKKMGLVPSDIWLVGDKIEYDIRGAPDASLYPVWYNWRRLKASPDGDFLEIHSMRELREEIESPDNIE